MIITIEDKETLNCVYGGMVCVCRDGMPFFEPEDTNGTRCEVLSPWDPIDDCDYCCGKERDRFTIVGGVVTRKGMFYECAKAVSQLLRFL